MQQAVTTEKAKDVADELVKKGSLTVRAGKGVKRGT